MVWLCNPYLSHLQYIWMHFITVTIYSSNLTSAALVMTRLLILLAERNSNSLITALVSFTGSSIVQYSPIWITKLIHLTTSNVKTRNMNIQYHILRESTIPVQIRSFGKTVTVLYEGKQNWSEWVTPTASTVQYTVLMLNLSSQPARTEQWRSQIKQSTYNMIFAALFLLKMSFIPLGHLLCTVYRCHGIWQDSVEVSYISKHPSWLRASTQSHICTVPRCVYKFIPNLATKDFLPFTVELLQPAL